MKILDRYIAKSFFVGYIISFCVLIGMRIFIDMFVNLDEFAEHVEDLGTMAVIGNILHYYGFQTTLYFKDFAGMITVVAAVFSLGKMTRNNELIAVMASGVSLKRVIAPIIIIAAVLSGILIIDQELLIPSFANKLVRGHDELPGQEVYEIWFLEDERNSLINSREYTEENQTMYYPTIMLRESPEPGEWKHTAVISADRAIYNSDRKGWDFVNGTIRQIGKEALDNTAPPEEIDFYATNVNPTVIPKLRQENFPSLLSIAQINEMERSGRRIKDLATLYSYKHFHITDPIINMVTLLVALPVLVCREPRAMKTAVIISFGITLACYLTTITCKMISTEVIFNAVRPELWAWTPVFIFVPIAFIEIDAMKT
jgi:lipopolysaccharide export LptBFGC system permease protein LptF